MPDINLSISYHIVILLACLIFFTALTVFVYRVTVPPVSNKKRILLVILRVVGLIILFMLVGEPLFSIISSKIEPPIVAVLIDNSMSMKIQDNRFKRDELLKNVFLSDGWQLTKKKTELTYATFDGKVKYLSDFNVDSLKFDGTSTDISKALKSVKTIQEKSNLQAVILISDGISNSGENPLSTAEELNIPVFTIGVGDTCKQKDLIIRKVITNEIAYIGTKVPVHVRINSAGFNGERAQISLRNSDELLDEKTISLESGTRDYIVPVHFIPDKEGLQKYTVDISKFSGELTTDNNQANFYVKVLKSKIQVALIAGSPSQDVAFINRILSNDRNIQVKTFIERPDGTFGTNELNKQSLIEVDCILLIGFPNMQTKNSSIEIINNAIESGKSLYLIFSRKIDFNKLSLLGNVLPFDLDKMSNEEFQVFAHIPELYRSHTILKAGSNYNTVEVWAKLPPIFSLQGKIMPKQGTQVLIRKQYQSIPLDDPLLIASSMNQRKTLALLGYGIWRWKMLSDIGSEQEQLLEYFISNSIRWLTTKEDERKIKVQPVKNNYSPEESIDFTAQIYDDNYQPIDDAQVIVVSNYKDETNVLVLSSLGSGQYQSAYEYLPQGEYNYTARVVVNDDTIGRDKGTFTVGGMNIEYLETRMNKPLLQQISVQTGGKYYDANKIDLLAEDITALPNFKSIEIKSSTEIELWNSRWMLLFVVIIFALEWFIRKQSGML